jgi:tRNA C32,U32 (ribose-2'-O)-methylase TrmJ
MLVKIPMYGKINSLNVSVAAALMMYKMIWYDIQNHERLWTCVLNKNTKRFNRFWFPLFKV